MALEDNRRLLSEEEKSEVSMHVGSYQKPERCLLEQFHPQNALDLLLRLLWA